MVKRAGRRLRTEHLEVRANGSLLSHARVAVVTGKLGHTVVERNLLRRRLRELVRLRMLPAIGPMDVMVRTLSSAYDVGFVDLMNEVDRLTVQLVAGSEV